MCILQIRKLRLSNLPGEEVSGCTWDASPGPSDSDASLFGGAMLPRVGDWL